MPDRPDVPDSFIERFDAICAPLPDCRRESAWVGWRWSVRGRTVAHVFGGEDQRLRIVVRTDPAELPAFEHSGEPYFRTEWGTNSVGMIIDDGSDWTELTELITESYRQQAPKKLLARLPDADSDERGPA